MTTPSPPEQNRRRALTFLGVGILVLVAGVAALASIGGLASTVEDISHHDAGNIVLDLRASGTVQILASDGDSISVERRIRDPWKRLTTDQRVEDNTLYVESRCALGWLALFRDCQADYVIRVPETTALSGDVDNGRVDVQGLRADIQVSTSNGAMSTTDTEGTLHLTTSNGDIDVVGAVGEVTVDTSNGSVHVRESTSTQTIELTTSNGAIEVSDTVGDLRLETSNGRITLTGTSSEAVFARTSNSAISMNLAASPEQLQAETGNGEIDIVLPPDSPPYAIETTTSSGTTDVGDVVNDPSAAFSISARTDNGDITIGER